MRYWSSRSGSLSGHFSNDVILPSNFGTMHSRCLREVFVVVAVVVF